MNDRTDASSLMAGPVRLVAALSALLLVPACAPPSHIETKPSQFHPMGAFMVGAGEDFLHALSAVDTVWMISLIDCRRERNEYKVNRRWIFGDTLQQEHPNLINYVTLSHQLQVEPGAMLNTLRAFDAMKVNEFRRMDGYEYMQVTVGFTQDRGYVHVSDSTALLGTKLPFFGRCLQLTRDLGKRWFEVEGVACTE